MPNRADHRPTSRVLDILELLAAHPQGLSLTEIAEAIQAPKSSIFPVIHTMLDRKFIISDKYTSKFTVGISAFCVGESYSSTKNVLQFINTEMKNIVDQINEICQMGILDLSKVLYVAKVDSKEAIRLQSYVGKRLPAYCTALGKALLCNHSMEQLQSLFPDGLVPYTQNTISTLELLKKELNITQITGYATETEELTEHIFCLAVPLVAEGKIIAALSVSMPCFRASEVKKAITKEVLSQAKDNIEAYFKTTNFDINDFIFEQ